MHDLLDKLWNSCEFFHTFFLHSPVKNSLTRQIFLFLMKSQTIADNSAAATKNKETHCDKFGMVQ